MFDISKTLKKMLINKEIIQINLAKKLGVSRSQLSRKLMQEDFRLNKDIVFFADLLGYDVKIQFIDRETGNIIDADVI